MISKRVQKMNISGIRKVFELGKQIKNPIDLSIGQPDFLVPDNVKKAACRAILADKNRYSLTQGIDELRDAVVKKIIKKNKIKITKENVLITSAVSGGLSVALPAIIDHGDEVIVFDPGFVGYKQLILLFGGVPVMVEKNDDFSINFDYLKKAITSKTRAIIFNTPENPTGYVAKEEEIKELVKIAKKYKLIIIADEIYEDFIYGPKHISIGAFYKNTITLNGFSKSQAITGWRIGYLCAPKRIIQEIIKVQQFTFVCAPTPLQVAACEALKTDISSFVKDYRKKRDMIYHGLQDCYEIVKPEGAFYFFIKYPQDSKIFMKKCLAHKLLVVPGDSFSAKNTHFRISFAASDKNIQKAVEILRKIYFSIKK
ncbi:MAG: pyridoxal phosphate-dependent aminotransferase [Candidatus Moranbacteria bacterium]|jgi:aspartate aminotransferase/aminotransferase|nr:pyridoxal phosphate-dependent aminotransferase [Candidatus Moranbacteria bacterium]